MPSSSDFFIVSVGRFPLPHRLRHQHHICLDELGIATEISFSRSVRITSLRESHSTLKGHGRSLYLRQNYDDDFTILYFFKYEKDINGVFDEVRFWSDLKLVYGPKLRWPETYLCYFGSHALSKQNKLKLSTTCIPKQNQIKVARSIQNQQKQREDIKLW